MVAVCQWWYLKTPFNPLRCVSKLRWNFWATHSFVCTYISWPYFDYWLLIRLWNFSIEVPSGIFLLALLTRRVSAQATPENVVPKSIPTTSFRSLIVRLLIESILELFCFRIHKNRFSIQCWTAIVSLLASAWQEIEFEMETQYALGDHRFILKLDCTE